MVEPRPCPYAALCRERERAVVARAHHDLRVDEIGVGERHRGELVSATGAVISIAGLPEVQDKCWYSHTTRLPPSRCRLGR